ARSQAATCLNEAAVDDRGAAALFFLYNGCLPYGLNEAAVDDRGAAPKVWVYLIPRRGVSMKPRSMTAVRRRDEME
ncbi:MAG: hypothetical protein ACREFQ_22530, partial [Stellaceae bacterium]